MSFQIKILALIALCFGFIIAARVLPVLEIHTGVAEGAAAPDKSRSTAVPNLEALTKAYGARSLFISKTNMDAALSEVDTTPSIVADWSPLDYDFIGVSISAGRKTGWFKHSAEGTLISARQDSYLGDWKLERLTSTEARLKLNDEKISLKLFQGSE